MHSASSAATRHPFTLASGCQGKLVNTTIPEAECYRTLFLAKRSSKSIGFGSDFADKIARPLEGRTCYLSEN
ncbi:hypothetical protein KR51_00030800 [Rubidibacter lacunae KORDI 51-2]|uniref:Uncharacterized protein n=1 Tax=Rubidibacter lacunae KORDI 51-2 TaxID=582515 RepID=U5DGZ4_9CHRO|nr:hypothetical protein KR51_00030800 [Rubidibacter lacunae KORDI 51-2]